MSRPGTRVAVPGPPLVSSRIGMKFCTAKIPDRITTIRNCGSSSGMSIAKTRRDGGQAVKPSRVEHVPWQVLQPAEEDQEPEVGDPRETDEQDRDERQVRVGQPGRLGQADRAEDLVEQPGTGLEQVGPDLDEDQRRQHDRQHQDVLGDAGRPPRQVDTISAAVNCEIKVMRMLPPIRIAMFLASAPKVGDCTYSLNWEIPA